MGRISTVIYVTHATFMFVIGLSLFSMGSRLVWFTSALGLFLCGTGLQVLSTALWGQEDEFSARRIRAMRLKHALHLAPGIAGGVAAFVYLPLPAAIIVSVFVSIWILLQAWMSSIALRLPGEAHTMSADRAGF